MIHRCETCPFWDNPKENHPGWGVWGRCSKADEEADQQAPLTHTPIYAHCDGDQGTLETRADFGCVMHPMNKAIA